MTGRITSAIVGVTAVVLLALGIPLAIATQRAVVSSEIVQLQATSAAALVEIAIPIDPVQLTALAVEPDAPPPFAVYDTQGLLVHGDGPPTADAPVRASLRRLRVVTAAGDRIIVATPIIDRTEQPRGVLRISQSRHEIDERTRAAWAVMAAAATAALGIAWLLARRMARQLSAPIEQLARRAHEPIDGVSREDLPRSGIAEIDQLADALHASSTRVAAALARERQFSADVSHQLRTPLAGIRLKLEAVTGTPGTGELARSVLADLGRVDATVIQLLALARDATPVSPATALRPLLEQAARRWHEPLAAMQRTIVARTDSNRLVMASANSVGQILDVLIDNAARHGHGTVAVTARHLPGGMAVDVVDDGTLRDSITDTQLFERRDGDGHGIGLSLARSLAEADDARLVLTSRHPTTFTLFLVCSPT